MAKTPAVDAPIALTWRRRLSKGPQDHNLGKTSCTKGAELKLSVGRASLKAGPTEKRHHSSRRHCTDQNGDFSTY